MTFVLVLFVVLDVTAAKNLNDVYVNLETQIAAHPEDVGLKTALAYVLTQGFEYERAAKLHEGVLTAQPGNFAAVSELCFLYTEMRLKERALFFCHQVVALKPDEPASHDNLGLSYFKLGLYKESLEPFLRALALDSSAIQVRYHFIQALIALGQIKMGRDMLMILALDDRVQDADLGLIYHGLYLVYEQLKDYPQAYAAVKKTYALSGNSLFLGKVIAAYIKSHQLFFFLVVSGVVLLLSRYFGQRVNRFLKNQ